MSSSARLVTRLYKEGTPILEILKMVKISKSTLYSYMQNETSKQELNN